MSNIDLLREAIAGLPVRQKSTILKLFAKEAQERAAEADFYRDLWCGLYLSFIITNTKQTFSEPRDIRRAKFFARMRAKGKSYSAIAKAWNARKGENLTKLNVRDALDAYRSWEQEQRELTLKAVRTVARTKSILMG